MVLPRWALAAWSHSSCRCGASLLMLGPACFSDLPASKAGCAAVLRQERPSMPGLLHKVGMLALNASGLATYGL